MSWGPLQPAEARSGEATAPARSALGMLAGNGLPQRWAGRQRFAVLDTGFGLGHRFLATWAAWQQDPRRCERLTYLAIDGRPPRREALARAHAGSTLAGLATALAEAWPPLTPDLHCLDFDGGRVRLLLAMGELTRVLPDLLARVDAICLDGRSPAFCLATWDRWRLRQLARLAAPGATLAAVDADDGLGQRLAAAGFEPVAADRPGITRAHHAPRDAASVAPGRLAWQAGGAAVPRRVAVIGAGLAGAAVAGALAARGIAVQVFDRQGGCARETSGNPGGLFHGVVHGQDGPHARWLRAGALHTARLLRPLLRSGAVAGGVDGLLRGEQRLAPDAMAALLAGQALPPEYLQVRRGDWPAGRSAAWFYPDGGWVDPAALCARWLQSPGISSRYGSAVQSLVRADAGWRLIGPAGETLHSADAVVLCNAWDAARLAGPQPAGAPWPLRRVRGQTSLLPADLPGLPALPLPLADAGYALRLADGRVLCGATAQPDDGFDGLRADDHQHNLATLRRLTGWHGADATVALAGRVGWRVQSDDRLPLLGALPDPAAPPASRRADQPRWLPRRDGLFVFTALGSRGIAQCTLGAEVLAAWITGDALPLPASLLDALDVARFGSRARRRAGAGSPGATSGE